MLTDLQTRKFNRLFDFLDADGNGVIEVADYLRFADLSGDDLTALPGSTAGQPLRESLSPLWERAIAPLDASGAGTVERDVFIKAMQQLITQADLFDDVLVPIADLFFTLLDLDDDGSVTQREYTQAMSLFGLPVADIDAFFTHADTDGDGRLTRDEFQVLVREFYFSDNPTDIGNVLLGPI
ncbi:EF-hand domain-containing protein [Sinosporangium siamense]|uniref:Calcium-binding protein n=1 Tax=Sinosporangium siamense TaxID=1367973 RepID=A0A919RAY0_9ACTN|nr:EF-hand domain-containing protein [Sinosporangium siamense]GII90162.1 calcium-binding protein [Sinosporangium siamense]